MPVTRSRSGAQESSSEATSSDATRTTATTTTGTTSQESTATEQTSTTEQRGTTEQTSTTASIETTETLSKKKATKKTPATILPAEVEATNVPPLSSLRDDDETLRPQKKTQSRRSGRKNIAILEAKQRLAQLQLEEAKAAAKVEKLRLEILQQTDSSEDEIEETEEERELTTQRLDRWLERQTQPLLAIEEPRTTRNIAAEEDARPSASRAPTSGHVNVREAPTDVERTRYGHQPRKESPTRDSYDMAALTAAFTEVARNIGKAAPKYVHELPPFSGLSSEWLSFKATFEETRAGFTALENVTRLRRSLKGTALESVTALLITHTRPEEIMQALERRFGRPDALVLAEMEKIKALPKVSDNPRDLCVFANRIANIVATVEVLKKPHYLQSPEMLRSTIEKLTPILKNKWYDFAALNIEDQPELKKLAGFLNNEADKCALYAPLEQEGEKTRRKTERTFAMEHNVSNKHDSRCPQCRGEHRLPECPHFLRADINNRWEIAKKHRQCFRCLKNNHRRSSCRGPVCGQDGCTLRHHKLLHHTKRHEETRPIQTTETRQEIVTPTAITECVHATNPDTRTHRHAFLKIARVTLIGPKKTCDTYALLDEGSTATILDAEVANSLGLQGPEEPMKIQGVNGTTTSHDSIRVNVTIKGRHEEEAYELKDARTVADIGLFTQSVRAQDIDDCTHLTDIKEELIYEDGTPQLLIGQDNWELIVSREVRNGTRNQPVASRTLLGWVLHGCRTTHSYPMAFCSHLRVSTKQNEDLENMMKKYFELESLNIAPRKQGSDPEKQALEILDKKSRRLPDGRFETGLLWKKEADPIPNNYENTLKRLKNLEKKLDRDEDLKIKYKERIDNLLKSNYAEAATEHPTGGRTWYLPHFAVVNPDKKKIRVVHDAAAKSHGRSLNDMLLPGPDLLQSLPGVIMKFRQHPIAVSSDIKEMFMQVKIATEDRDALRFLWRGDRRDDKPPEEYRMTSLIFGATSSPCTALYIKNRNAEEYKEQFPAAVRAICDNHYMDDYLQSFPTSQEAKEITSAVDFIHQQAGFELRGWRSNKREAIAHLCPLEETTESTEIEIGGSIMEKTLGLLWHVNEDTLGFRMNTKRVPPEVLEDFRPPTKREALSLIMSIFDPLGLISPVLTTARRIMQDTWKYKTDWDDPIPEELQQRWQTWLTGLRLLPSLRVPRCYDYELVMEQELHTFVDASEEAYAAIVYIRSKRFDGSINVAIAAAKSRVTPSKLVSIPRLELQAAVLGARLTRSVEEGHNGEMKRKTYWSDSRTALAWIRNEPRAYKSFVAHRLAEIEDLTKKNEWRWVPTAVNTADDATRATPHDFASQHRWFTGPKFLYEDEDSWPQEVKKEVPNTGEEREKCAALQAKVSTPIIDFNRFSSWTRLLRTVGRVLQFIELCRPPTLITAARRKRTQKKPHQDPEWRGVSKQSKEAKKAQPTSHPTRKMKILEASFLHRAERLLFRYAQSCLLEQRQQHSTSTRHSDPLNGLRTMIDYEGVLRLQGRVNEAEDISYEAANPIILDGKHRCTKLYIQHVHERLHHGGIEIVVNELRQRLWMQRIRPTVKEVIRSCPRCRLRKAKPASPSTGNLPSARLAHHERPFTFTGLDHLGPFEVTVARHREKRYIALFTCLTSRAVHLEIATSLSADAAINALRRFIARRGYPTELWSDNATCFRAADRELTEAWRALEEEATRRHISWRFLPPAAPFMAGAWERMVRTVKEALRVTLHEQRPSDETLATLLAEVEATVNSRPLTHVAVTPDTPPALTPNMILLGPNSHIPTPGTFEESDVNARAHWRRAQRLADIFWRRWVKEYLPLLQHRREPYASGTSPKIGDLVIICDSNLPRNIWPRGRVTNIFPGKDGETRVVDVTTSNGHVLRRPTKKIVVLPVESQDATAGEMFTTKL